MTNGERKLCECQARMTGNFYTSLFACLFAADTINLAHLSKAFPEEVAAVIRYKNEDDYWEKLESEWDGERG